MLPAPHKFPSTAELEALLVVGKAVESRTLELKERVVAGPKNVSERDGKKDPEQRVKKLARQVASMANTDGGLIIVGVRERKLDTDRVIDGFEAVELDETRKSFAAALELLRPRVNPEMDQVRVHGQQLFVVAVPPSVGLIAVQLGSSEGPALFFPIRSDHGIMYLGADDVATQNQAARRASIMLQALEATGKRVDLGGQLVLETLFDRPVTTFNREPVWLRERLVPPQGTFIQQVHETYIELKIAMTSVHVPLGWIDEVWPTAGSTDTLGMVLRGKIVARRIDGRAGHYELSLEP